MNHGILITCGNHYWNSTIWGKCMYLSRHVVLKVLGHIQKSCIWTYVKLYQLNYIKIKLKLLATIRSSSTLSRCGKIWSSGMSRISVLCKSCSLQRIVADMMPSSKSSGLCISGSPAKQKRRDEDNTPKKRFKKMYPKNSWFWRCNKTTVSSFWTIMTGCLMEYYS